MAQLIFKAAYYLRSMETLKTLSFKPAILPGLHSVGICRICQVVSFRVPCWLLCCEVTNDELDTYFSDNLPSCEQMTRVTICDTDGQSTHQAKQ